jgi:hypothetical protein
MWFWWIYLGLAAVGVVLSLLGWAGSGLLRRFARSTAEEHQAIRPGPRHRRDLSQAQAQPIPDAGAAEDVATVKAMGPVSSGLLRCSGFALSLGTALVVSSTCVVALVLSVEALYWSGERLFGPDWVEFLDGLLG